MTVFPTQTPTTAPAEPASEPVRLGFVGRPETWWVETLEASSPTEALMRRLVTRAAARPAQDARPMPDLGRWRWADKTLVVTWEEITWSNGQPLNAQEVVSAINRAGNGNVSRFLPFVRAEVAGPRTVRLSFASDTLVCPTATEVLLWPLGEGTWPPTRTLGPYRVAHSPSVWRLRPQDPALPDVWLLPFEESRTLARAWRAGEVDLIVGDDWLYGQTPLPMPSSGNVRDLPSNTLVTLAFRLEDPVLGDSAVRQALALATDPTALAKRVYGTPLPQPTALLPPGHWAAPEKGVPVGNPALAAQRLSRAGWRDRDGDGIRENGKGEPLALTLLISYSPTDARWEHVGPALADQWRRVGVDLTISYQAPFSLRERLSNGQWDVALIAYTVGPDPDQQFLWTASDEENLLTRDLNVMGYANASVGRLMREAASLPGCSPDERARLYRRAWSQIANDVPLLPLFPRPVRLFAQERATPLLPWVASTLRFTR
ncbi:MAG: ABC transporter substrate-binding protein [Ardenticatenia bacterium]|nr:ABC transporter substrate-binding protein [Ardenticatenia bacterium]